MDVRWVAYIGSGLLAAVSLVPVTVSRPTDAQATPTAARARAGGPAVAPDPVLMDVEKHAARLRDYARSAPLPRAPGRNPFDYARHGPAPSRADTLPGLRAPVPELPLAREPVPALSLVGMAERTTADGPVRTAIVAGFDDVHLVSTGDRVAGRYLVTAIRADAIELLDETTGEVLRLALK